VATEILAKLGNLVEEMARSLVDFPDQIDIKIETEEKLKFIIMCHYEDKKRLIGKHGVLINSMRSILHCSAAKYKLRTELSIFE
jgi:predicted RNA-binding protein YlqC (UPF0109 family)